MAKSRLERALTGFRPQRRNANRHTQRGMGLLERSIQTDGYSTPMVAAADGEIFDGSARLEKVGSLMADAEPIVVHSDGTRPVIHVRDDIPTADDPRAQRLAVAANRIAEVNLDWDATVLEGLPEIASGMWLPDELVALGVTAPDFQPVSVDEQGRLDQKKPVTCPECGHEFVPK